MSIYQESDWEVVDYQLYLLDPEITDDYLGGELIVRGPKPPSWGKNSYFSCLGAAQTFGRFCQQPYPNLLSEQLNLPLLNLGFGGVSASFFGENKPKLIEYINNGKFAIIQVMSGRSQDNSIFKDCRGYTVTKIADGSQKSWVDAYQELLDHEDPEFCAKIIAETRQNWVNSYIQLLEKITVPKILLWFSTRSPQYHDSYQDVHQLFNQFPQLVNSEMIAQLSNYVDEYAECVSTRGIPQQIISRFTGKPTVAVDNWDGQQWATNSYYPSPEMHIDAYNVLKSCCQKYRGTINLSHNNMQANSVNNSLTNQSTDIIPIVFFGRLEERKGLCTFIEAIKLLDSQLQQQIKITFMGKVVPLYSAELKDLNSEQYVERELDNQVQYQIISDFYSQQAIEYICDLPNPIVCLASPQENFPNTALEMGQLPVTIVASDTGGFRETLKLVQRQEGVYWFKPKDADALSLRLAEAIANYPETPQVIAKSTIEAVNEQLLVDKINRIESAFERIKPTPEITAKVSIGIIYHQGGEHLVECLGSLEAQTYKNLEIIIIGDGLKDDHSQDMFTHAQSLFPQFKFIEQETYQGRGASRNHLLSLASGDYFLFINPSVILFPFAVEKFLITAANNQPAIVTCAQKEIGAVNRIINYQGGALPTLMMNNVYCGEGCLFSRDILTKFPFTDNKQIQTQTWEVIAAALVTGEKIVYYPYPLYEYIVEADYPTSKSPSHQEKYSLRQYLGKIPPTNWTKKTIVFIVKCSTTVTRFTVTNV